MERLLIPNKFSFSSSSSFRLTEKNSLACIAKTLLSLLLKGLDINKNDDGIISSSFFGSWY